MQRDLHRREPEEAEITAQPTQSGETPGTRVLEEKGLAVDPEELGQQFLAEATEQGNFESSVEDTDIVVPGPAPSDETLSSLYASGNAWDRTVEAAAEGDDLTPPLIEPAPEVRQRPREAHDEELSLIEDEIDETSLFDTEGDELGEARSPRLDTDDSGKRARRLARRHPRSP